MKEQYINNIDTHREVLGALPKNNAKDLASYHSKVEELKQEYEEDKKTLFEEITKRSKPYMSVAKEEKIDVIDAKLKELVRALPIINIYNSSYQKSGLDIVLYQIDHYYKINLELVNSNILRAINIFNIVGIKITIDDFNYSYYAKKYMEKFFLYASNNDLHNEALKDFFENIYWKCPDVISHITLNFKYLYYLNIKQFDIYYDNLVAKLKNENIKNNYISLSIEKENILNNSKYIILHKFLDDELDVKDYDDDKINKELESISTSKSCSQDDILDLSHTLYEYKLYLSFSYLIEDLKKLYAEKDKYKGIFAKKMKEITKKERELFKKNKKILKSINKPKKFNYYNNTINEDIKILKGLYEELENNFFLEKVALLNDDSTILDLLYLANSNYNYLIELFKKNEKESQEEFLKLNNLIYYPFINIINNLWIKDEKDVSLIIINKYNLCNFNLNQDMLSSDNLENLIDTTKKLINKIILDNNKLELDKIKFVKEAEKIRKEYN